jgi:hypothetical protein
MVMPKIGSTSVRLNRKSWILGPFAHRAVVEREVVVTELMQEEEVDCCGDAATAIADDLFSFVTPLTSNFAVASARVVKPLVAGSMSVAADTLTLPGTRPGRP